MFLKKNLKFQLKNLTMQSRVKALYEHLYEALS